MRLFFARSNLTVAIACLVMLSWSARSRAADSWNKIQSKNFVIVGEVGYGRLGAIAKTLEQFRLATTRLFPNRVCC